MSLRTDFLALFSSEDANFEWMEDDEAVIPVLSATREADAGICRRAAWIHIVSNRVQHRFELVECSSVAVTLSTCFALVTSYRLYVPTLVICRWWNRPTVVALIEWFFKYGCIPALEVIPRSMFSSELWPIGMELSRTTIHLWQDWMTCKGLLAFEKDYWIPDLGVWDISRWALLDSAWSRVFGKFFRWISHLGQQDRLDGSL